MSEWISVKDRLPQEDGWYLVATTYNSVTMLPYDKSYDGKPHFYNGTIVWDKRITHWMPLPEPPKEDKMRLIDANELMEHVWRDRLDSREAIAEMVNSAPTVRNAIWISVKDEVPPEDETVLAWNKEGFPMINVWRGKRWSYARTVGEISHWMPLPKKPESENDV